jgi:hypothetical protein
VLDLVQAGLDYLEVQVPEVGGAITPLIRRELKHGDLGPT